MWTSLSLFFVVGVTCIILSVSSATHHHYHHRRLRRQVESAQPQTTPITSAEGAVVGPIIINPNDFSSEEKTPAQKEAEKKRENYHEKLSEQAGGHWAKFKVKVKQAAKQLANRWDENVNKTVHTLGKGLDIVKNITIGPASPEEDSSEEFTGLEDTTINEELEEEETLSRSRK